MIQGALVSKPVISRHGIFFWLLRTLVKVRWWFFASAVLLGLRSRSPMELLVWVVVSFAAILLHEMGHALAARIYGQTPQIELHGFGGVTKWAWVDELKWSQRVFISLAGPGIGLLIGGLIAVRDTFVPSADPYLFRLATRDFLWVTLGWGLFNLLPLMPMDGGQAMSEILEHRMGQSAGRHRARQISCVTGGIGLVVALLLGHTWAALLCGIFAFDNYQRMRGLPGVELGR